MRQARLRFSTLLVTACTVVSLTAAQPSAAPGSVSPPDNPAAAQGLRRGTGTSPPVTPRVMDRDLRTLPLLPEWTPGTPVREIPLQEGQRPPPGAPGLGGPEDVQDPEALRWEGQASVVPPEFATPDPNFEGLNQAQGGGFVPPDTQGDIGPDHYIQVVNVAFAIFDREGTRLAGPTAINRLWEGFGGDCEDVNAGDPIVNYDHLADRWFITQFTFPVSNNQCFAVSRGPDPVKDGWYLYQFALPGVNDYPKVGVWPDAYFMGSQRGYFGGGLDLYAFDRANMLNGNPATFQHFHVSAADTNNRSLFLLPSDLDGPPPRGTPNTFIRHVDGELHGGADRLEVFDFYVNWQDPEAALLVGPTAIPTVPFSADCAGGADDLFQTCVDQPDTAQRLETLAAWTMWRAQFREFPTHQTLVTNHTIDVDGNDHVGIRWYELRRTAGGDWGIFQQGTYSPDAGDPGLEDDPHRFMGSIAMDRFGNMALGFSASSETLHPSVRYVGRRAGDPLGLLPQGGPPDGDFTLIEGEGSQMGSERWGDYSSMNIDPLDDCTFWYTNEYVGENGAWRTRIGAFRFTRLDHHAGADGKGCGGDEDDDDKDDDKHDH